MATDDRVVLASSDGDGIATLSALSGYDSGDRYTIQVTVVYEKRVQASVEVSDIRIADSDEMPSLPGYFRRLADDWKGWVGTREWQSVDQRLHLRCTTDRIGHAYLSVSIRGDQFLRPQWEATVTVVLDVVQRERAAREMALYFAD